MPSQLFQTRVSLMARVDQPLPQKRHWQLQPCSAVTGDGLVTGIDWMVSDIASRIFMMD